MSAHLNANPSAQHRQQGAVLLGFTLLMVIAVSTLLLTTLNRHGAFSENAGKDLRVLSHAREALLGYALSYPEVMGDSNLAPGKLPCPDFDGDGLSDAPCNGNDQSSIGRLPWRTLGIEPLRDSANECLWYAVAGSYKQGNAIEPSSETDGMLVVENLAGGTIVGSTAEQRALALVFAPGAQLDGQSRDAPLANQTECGATSNNNINRVANYLESLGGVDNATGRKTGAAAGSPGANPLPTSNPSVFVNRSSASNARQDNFNDALAWISPDSFDNVHLRMNRWVADRVQRCLLAYGDSHAALTDRYPFAAQLDASAAIDFNDDSGQRFGRIPADLANTVAANAGMRAFWPADPLDASTNCFNWSWWPSWRNQVFYAVHDANAPAPTGGGNLSANGGGAQFVVVVAGRAMNTQSRATVNERGSIENYLESDNIPSTGDGALPGGDEAFSSTGAVNDVLCDDTACYF